MAGQPFIARIALFDVLSVPLVERARCRRLSGEQIARRLRSDRAEPGDLGRVIVLTCERARLHDDGRTDGKRAAGRKRALFQMPHGPIQGSVEASLVRAVDLAGGLELVTAVGESGVDDRDGYRRPGDTQVRATVF